MKYIDEFRNRKLAEKLSRKIKEIMPHEQINIMEVCGTHTQSFFRFGLKSIIPSNLRLIAGPGCPVCVSSQAYIDNAIRLAQNKDTIILSFGDMLRIPGSSSTLENERAKFGNVQVVYSPLDSIRVAKLNPKKKVVFLAVGFETTAPTIALSIIAAKKEKLENLSFYPALKLIPAAMKYLVEDKCLKLNGFLCPGHVSAIIGTRPYEFIAKKYKLACCIAGFEAIDILEGFYFLVRQIVYNKPIVENQYTRVVKEEGNPKAIKILNKVFKTHDTQWRGLGLIPKSGLSIKNEYSRFDATRVFDLRDENKNVAMRNTRCRCGEILKGLISPVECPLFSKACTPESPIGPCMVSIEGACNAYYKYQN